MRLGVLSVVALAVALAGCSPKQSQDTGTNLPPDTSLVAQNQNAPAGGATGISERERQSQQLPPGEAERRAGPRRRATPPSRHVSSGGTTHHTGGGAVASAPRTHNVTVPSGKSGDATLSTDLSSETNHEGDTFTAELSSDWVVDGQVVLAAGSKVYGHVSAVEAAGRGKSKAYLTLAYDKVGLPGGGTVELTAQPQTFKAEGTTKRDVGLIGGGTVIGGIIGKATGSTGKGAVIGGAAGTAAALAARGKPMKLEAGHKVEIVLSGDMQVPVSRTGT